jgi:uncharacterized protein YjiS (DUF1127 family)
MRWAGHITRMRAKRNGRRVLVEVPEVQLNDLGETEQDYIKTDLRNN